MYYGGIGFNDNAYPVTEFSESGRRMNGDMILCSQDFGMECSEQNSQSILGQSLSDLTLATSLVNSKTNSQGELVELEDVLDLITAGGTEYRVNDFYVAVFAVSGSTECASDDGSGCCVAHGGGLHLVGLTWQELLDAEGITSIRGMDLHQKLVIASDNGVGDIEYPYSRAFGVAQTKRAWAAKFQQTGQSYYVVSEYLKTDQPPTCDACPSDMECTNSEQSFCEMKPSPHITENGWFLFLVIFLAAGIPLSIFYIWWQKRKYRIKKQSLANQLKDMAEALEQQMQGMVEIVHDLPIQSPEEYRRKFGDEVAGSSQHHVHVSWYWEEDPGRVGSHKKEFLLDGTNFVSYSREISEQIEHAFNLFGEGKGFHYFRVDLTDKILSTGSGGKVYGAESGSHYEVDFERMTQKNSNTDFERNLRREEVEMNIASNLVGDLPLLPEDINFSSDLDGKEDLLPTFKGQVIQVSKVHSGNEWLFGNVLYDPLMDDVLQQNQSANTAGLNTLLANALHGRPTSGWFPRAVSTPADVNVMQTLLTNLGGEGGLDALSPPSTWDEAGGLTSPLSKGSPEFDEVDQFFRNALYGQRGSVNVVEIQRIQNLPLWQSYAVKKQTMRNRDQNDFSHRVNNKDANLDSIERRWLFHGTQPGVISKIIRQGFNRAFAGRNAVRYGKGVYYARDSCYSLHETYSVPDQKGVQHMFLCRVAVGDWCKGVNEQLTPDPKPHNSLELFDTTVDNVKNPSIFVAYHDAQAYPEYLVSFKRKGSGMTV